MSKTLFGPRGKVIEGHMDAWCMAKVRRLVGRFEEPQSPEKRKEWRLACGLEATEYRDSKSGETKLFIALKPLREQLEELPHDLCSAKCIDFILYLFTLDYQNRLTASEALKHPYIRSVELHPQQVGISDRGFHLRPQRCFLNLKLSLWHDSGLSRIDRRSN